MNGKRPTVLTVFGIMNILFGSIWSLCCFCSGGGLLFVGIVMKDPPPGDQEFQEQIELLRSITDNVPSAVTYVMVLFFGTAILSVFMLIAGIGLLKVQQWGRTLSIFVAACNIALYIGLMVYFLAVVSPDIQLWAPNAPGRFAPPPQQNNQTAAAVEHVSTMFFLTLYSILLLIFMLLTRTGNAFKSRSGLGSDQYDRDQEIDDYDRRRRDEPS